MSAVHEEISSVTKALHY